MVPRTAHLIRGAHVRQSTCCGCHTLPVTSLFELFKIGIGPSSSHTVGPMRGALAFVRDLDSAGLLPGTARVVTELYGSLALTGIGHATDRAILAGLCGEAPDSVTPAAMDALLLRAEEGHLLLNRTHRISFTRERDLLLHRQQMYPDADAATHPNGMRFTALGSDGNLLHAAVFYSIGGGFIVTADQLAARLAGASAPTSRTVPFPFRSAADLLHTAAKQGMSIADVVFANELALLHEADIRRPAHDDGDASAQVRNGVLAIWHAMLRCMERGMVQEGVLPGGLNVRRRAPRLTSRLRAKVSTDPLAPLDWVTIFAIAVNEENAAGGQVVTAPTNGAAGVLPAVARYYQDFVAGADEDGLLRYFLTAAAIAILYKENASISGAEVGCQGEVGVACSMAAGGLAAALGGSNAQVEHAAEIAMEHNLGMTCDPIGGLVQIPCIERNAMGAIKAVNATRMAMNELDEHKVSLDQVIRTMYLTGLDMQSRYKETSLAGLALNVIEC